MNKRLWTGTSLLLVALTPMMAAELESHLLPRYQLEGRKPLAFSLSDRMKHYWISDPICITASPHLHVEAHPTPSGHRKP